MEKPEEALAHTGLRLQEQLVKTEGGRAGEAGGGESRSKGPWSCTHPLGHEWVYFYQLGSRTQRTKNVWADNRKTNVGTAPANMSREQAH